jgi:lysophospholipase L1-like esterase
MTKQLHLTLIAAVILSCVPVWAQLKPDDRLAITGDSITEQKMYSVFIEDYLLACKPQPNVRAMQYGWGGETSWGFLGRIDNDCLQFHPTIATTCFGMNDGGYGPPNPERMQKYREAMTGLADAFEKAGVRAVLGSPGCVDSTTFRNNPEQAADYNKTLAAERDVVKQIAEQRHVPFADVYDAMHDVMDKAKAKYGSSYHVAGGDGVHPSANGHLVMAYAFLKALGCDGNIGTITLDLPSKKASGTEGQAIKSFDGTTVTIESTRWPYCFWVDPKIADKLDDPGNHRGVLPFLPFNQDLNRYMLVVTGAPADKKIKVTWGDSSKEFSADELAKGINLADEFLDNPFIAPFRELDKLARAQQNFETVMIKNLVHGVKYELPDNPELIEPIAKATSKRQQMLSEKAVGVATTPLTHTIKIERLSD